MGIKLGEIESVGKDVIKVIDAGVDVIRAGEGFVDSITEGSGNSGDITRDVLSGALFPKLKDPRWTPREFQNVLQGASAAAAQNLRNTVLRTWQARPDVKTPLPQDDTSIARAGSYLAQGGALGDCGQRGSGTDCQIVREAFGKAATSFKLRVFGVTEVVAADGTRTPVAPDGTVLTESTRISGVTTTAGARPTTVTAGTGLLSSPVALVAAGLAVALFVSR